MLISGLLGIAFAVASGVPTTYTYMVVGVVGMGAVTPRGTPWVADEGGSILRSKPQQHLGLSHRK